MENKFVDGHPLLQGTETVNPYRHLVNSALERLRWDLNLNSWSSRKKIKAYKDKYKGQKAVILCNGPSLNKVDFDLLKGTFTIGLNKINLLFERTSFRPSIISVINGLVIEQNKDFYNETNIPVFVDYEGKQFVSPRENIIYLHSSHQQKFARDVSVSVWKGGTVTFVAMQLAYHMGFENVALVGCDHYFNAQGAANQTAISTGKDDSHFDPNYFANGLKWQLPDIATSEYSYSLAKEAYEADNRKIYNATDGGYLEIFERRSLENFING